MAGLSILNRPSSSDAKEESEERRDAGDERSEERTEEKRARGVAPAREDGVSGRPRLMAVVAVEVVSWVRGVRGRVTLLGVVVLRKTGTGGGPITDLDGVSRSRLWYAGAEVG